MQSRFYGGMLNVVVIISFLFEFAFVAFLGRGHSFVGGSFPTSEPSYLYKLLSMTHLFLPRKASLN
jgi:hypothetical protein